MYVRGPISASTLLVAVLAGWPLPAAAGDSTCATFTPADLPVRLPPGAAGARISILDLAVGGMVESVEVLDLQGRHTDTSELSFHLTSPQGTQVDLMERCLGAPGIDFDLQLSDAAAASLPCPVATDGGTYLPAQPLSTFAGESMQGIWTFTVFGHVHGNGGWLDSWKLHVCYSTAPELAIDPDPLDFGRVLAGTTSDARSVTLSNPGTAPLTISELGAAAAPFAEAGGNCGPVPIELAPGTGCTLDYSFSPTVLGLADATIGVTSDAEIGPTSFGLEGLGVLPPQVATVGTVGRTRGGLEATTQAYVAFDAPMAASAGLATSFQLTAGGANGVVETTACGPLAGDDEAVSIDAASYDPDNDTSHLWIDGGVPLAPARYALFACADALADEDGNGLDGNGDNAPGGDHTTHLLVKVDHLLVANPNFDSGLGSWTVGAPADVTWAEYDIAGVATSGSLFLDGTQGGTGPWLAEQCVAADALEVSFRLLGSAWVAGAAEAWATAELFGSGDCTGAPVGMLATPVIGDTGGTWLDLTTPFHRLPAAGVSSARITLQATGAGEWSAGWDEVAFWGASIFHGDFESGDTGQWTSSVGD